ncbi:MAG: phage major capsid protein [Alteromonas macleodii]
MSIELKAELQAGLKTLETQVDKALSAHTDEVKEMGKASAKTTADMKAMLEDHASIRDQLKALGDDFTTLSQQSEKLDVEASKQEGLGTQFVNSDAFKNFVNGSTQKASATFQNNTIVTGGDNSVTDHFKLPGVVPGAFRKLGVMPTVAQGQTNSNIVYFSRELAWTNAAAETAENTTKPESTLTFEEVNTPIQTIAHWLKISKQALSDSPFVQSYVDGRLSHGVRQRMESQIINGDGLGANYSGWLASGNSTATSPLLTTDIFGLANKMKTEIEVADYMADYFYMNPLDWSAVETIRRGTGDAAFVGGDGGVVNYAQNGMPAMLWGIPVITSNAVPSGTMICKSVDADMHVNREGVTVQMFEQDGTNVQDNLVTVRAEARGAELIFTPAAIRTGDINAITAPV